MLSEVFYWVVNISIIGSIAGLVILALRKIKKLPKFAIYLLWATPLFRFWLPFGIANPYSLLSVISKFTTKTVVIWDTHPEFTATNSIMAANCYFPVEYKTRLLANIIGIAAAIWLIAAIIVIAATILLYIYTKLEIHSAELLKDNIYKSDIITSPAVYGIIHPKIIVPAVIATGDIHYIVKHEGVHIKRKDNLLRAIAIFTACIHWFNPLVWIFLKCFLEDMELACDGKVLKSLNEEQTKEYANAILACSASKTVFTSAFGGAKTKVRIENIVSYKKLTVFSTLCFTALLVTIAIALATNAAV